MSTVTVSSPTHRELELLGQTVVVIGGSAGIGFETARRARAEGAKVILTGRNAERLRHAASEVDALSTAAFDVPVYWLRTRMGRLLSAAPLDQRGASPRLASHLRTLAAHFRAWPPASDPSAAFISLPSPKV